MSNVTFDSTTALLGSALKSKLRYAVQNVIAWRLSTPNVILSTLKLLTLELVTLSLHSRLLTGLQSVSRRKSAASRTNAARTAGARR